MTNRAACPLGGRAADVAPRDPGDRLLRPRHESLGPLLPRGHDVPGREARDREPPDREPPRSEDIIAAPGMSRDCCAASSGPVPPAVGALRMPGRAPARPRAARV